MTGRVEPGSPLLVVLDLHNAGTTPATGLTVEGELDGDWDRARVKDALAAGKTTRIALSFRRAAPTPGTHAVTLQLDYQDPAGTGASQRAWLLAAFGEVSPALDVEVSLPDGPISTVTTLPVRVRSRAPEPRRVTVRVLPARGLQVPDPDPTVEVPAGAELVVPVRLLRGGAPRPSRQGLVVVAEWNGARGHAVAVTTAHVDVASDPALLPRLRPWLVGLGAALLIAALALEVRRFRGPRREA